MAGNNSAVILAVSWTETCIGLFLFSLRFLSNWKFVGRFRWDFAVAGLTVATEVVAQIFLQFSVNAGMGHHLDDLSDLQIVKALHWSWVFQLLAIASSMLGKLAILAFLIQIRGRHDTKPWFLIILGVLIGTINIAVLGTILGQCKPMHKLWDDSVEGTCDPGRKMNQNYSFFQASFNAFSDALLASYPIHLFWKLQMKLRIKVALSVLMGLGWVAAVCSAVKTYELKALTQTTDITYAQSSLLIWASTEAWIVIIVGCIPPIRPLMERVMQRLGLSSKKTSTPYQYRDSSGHAAYGTHKSNLPSHSHFQSNAFGGRKSFDDDLGWMELTTSGGTNGSKEHIVNTQKDVMVRTEIVTRFEDAEGQGPSGSNISDEDLMRDRKDQKVV
ncbi:uncharacterized protein PGRI_043510 [Penicillium griseofulvum]|uniref:Rhodopsin domain-containing protein n=1 Tax=Penicillium patulum TaxID=5078 RepID=A0A135LNQ0_PENPA|nr:uncharacterized protein PGRI_043510 [Penicillium griseofulvum]KXG50584.1 hypothetical protein PGRI_043510 [Penicillium griseofulvum]